MKDYPTLLPKRMHKRCKRNYHKLTLREALKKKKLSESVANEDKAAYGQNSLTHREVLQTIAAWKMRTGIKCTVRIADATIAIRME